MKSRSKAAIAAAALLLATGCSASANQDNGSDGSDGSGENVNPADCTAEQAAKDLTVRLAMAPCPVRGEKQANATISILDAAGKPSSQGPITVKHAMEAMNMPGGSTTVKPNGDKYEVRILLGMTGPWDIRVAVKGAGEAHFTLDAK